jgi:hypothetical protein
MYRRRFLLASMYGAFAPAMALAGPGLSSKASLTNTHVFVDDRFPVARRAALTMTEAMPPIRVGSDVTGVWRNWLEEAALRDALTLEGITTESFHFCLKTLLEERVRVSGELWKIDRDVYRWVLHCAPRHAAGIPS